MHIPEFWGSDRWGMRFLGIIAVIWTIDCFVGFYPTLPSRRAGRGPSVGATGRPAQGLLDPLGTGLEDQDVGQRLSDQFRHPSRLQPVDLGLLFVIAFTAFSLNLYFEVFSPLMKTVSNYTPTPYEQRPYRHLDDPIEPRMTYPDIAARAAAEGKARGWTTPIGSINYGPAHGVYAVAFFEPGDEHGAAGRRSGAAVLRQ